MFKTKTGGLPKSTFGFGHLDFGNSDLFRISCFGFRASDFVLRISNLLVLETEKMHGDRTISGANE
jgi:hypothetical protein